MDMERKNYYQVLEIPENAAPEEIRTAYRRAQNSYSKDSVAMYSLMTEDECLKILELVEEAFSILGDPIKKREYDSVRGLNLQAAKAPTLPGTSLSERIKETKERFEEDFGSTVKSVMISKVAAKTKFDLDFEYDAKFEEVIENTSEFSGGFLKKIREYKNVSIERLADMTRISKTHLRHLEDEEISKLPAEVYTRGFVYQYAKALKLNPDLVATSFIHHIRRLKAQ